MKQCIECGSEVDHLYREFNKGIIKIAHCKSCNAVADKYVEYDKVIILLDALLLQSQAYRHLLINTQITSHWRFALLLWVSNAFIQLVLQRAELASSQTVIDNVQFSYLDFWLYLNFMIAALELLSFLLSVLSVFALRSLLQTRNLQSFDPRLLTGAVIVASLGRILAIPALFWGQSDSRVYIIWMCQGYVCLSTLQALRVVNQGSCTLLWSTVAIGLGFSTQLLVSLKMQEWFAKQSFSL